MKTFSLLVVSPFAGVFWLIMLFVLSFLLVHLLLFAKAGWEVKHPKKPPVEQEKTTPQKQPEPIYYIVEKKKKRPKSSYSPPREIHFQ